MRCESKPGRVTGHFYCLGPPPAPSFLLEGDRPVIFDAGIYVFGGHYRQEIVKRMGSKTPSYLFLSHMHFDHCGAAGFLKRIMPELTIAASKEAAEIIQKPSAIGLIQKLNTVAPDGKVYFEPFSVERILEDGEIVEVADNLHVQVVKTPGHTRDMLSFYIPQYKTLIPSESVGVPGLGDYIFSEFLTDYHTYLASLERLAAYDVEILVLAHGWYYTAEDAKAFIPRAIKYTRRFRRHVETLLKRYGADYEKIVSTIKREEYDPITGDKQPKEAYLINLQAKIKAVEKIMRQ